MEENVRIEESGVKRRFEECLLASGLSKYDSQIIACGIAKGNLQSMWNNATGDVPGRILEAVCQLRPQINADYICRGVGTPLKDESDESMYLGLLKKLLESDRQMSEAELQRKNLYAEIAELVK